MRIRRKDREAPRAPEVQSVRSGHVVVRAAGTNVHGPGQEPDRRAFRLRPWRPTAPAHIPSEPSTDEIPAVRRRSRPRRPSWRLPGMLESRYRGRRSPARPRAGARRSADRLWPLAPASAVAPPPAAAPTRRPAGEPPWRRDRRRRRTNPGPPNPRSPPRHGHAGTRRSGTTPRELLNGAKPRTRELPRVIAIANQKGGVGKTTTTVNLGAALAELGYRVLVVDLDPQGNATTGLGVDARNFELSMYDVIMRDQPLEDCIEPTSVKNLFVAPATIDLAGVEIELVPAFSRELKLKRAIDTVVDDFDFVLIDCPPVARPDHGQRSGRGRRGARPDPVRVLRPRGSEPAPAQRQPGLDQPERDAGGHARSC